MTSGATLCRSRAADDIASSNRLALAGDIVWISGAVTAAVGIVLLATHAPAGARPSSGLRLVPVVTASCYGAVVTSSF